MRRALAVVVASCVFVSVFATLVQAATYTWDPSKNGHSDGAGTWNTASTNWWNGTADVAPSTNGFDTLVFGAGGAGGTVTLGNNQFSGVIVFNPVVGGNYTLNTSNIYVGGNASNNGLNTFLGSGAFGTGAAGIYDNATGVTSINGGALGSFGPVTFSTVAGGTLAIGSQVFTDFYPAQGFGNFNLVGGGVVSITNINSSIPTENSFNAIGGTLNMGPLPLSAGGSGFGVYVGPNAALNVANPTAGFANRTYNVGGAVGGSGVINVNNTGSGISGGWVVVMNQWNQAFAADPMPQLQFTGTININSGVFGTDNVGGVAGQVLGSATVNIASAGVLAMHGAADGWTIGSLNGAGAVTPATSGGVTYTLTVGAGNQSGNFTGIIHGNNTTGGTDGAIEAGFLALTKIGTGTQTLSGTNTYTGLTTVAGGQLLLDFSAANAPASNVLFNNSGTLGVVSLSGGTLGVNAGSGANTQGVASIAVGAGGLNISNGGGSMALTAGSLTRAAGGMMLVNLGTGAGSNTLTLTSTSGLTFSGPNNVLGFAAVADSTGTGFGTVNGSNNLVRNTNTSPLATTGNNSTTDYTTTPTDPGYSSGTLAMSGPAAADSLVINAASNGAINLGGNTLSLTSGGLLMYGPNNYTISNGQLGASGAEVIVNQLGPGALTIASSLSGGAGTLSVGGGGSVFLTGSSAYTGSTYIGNGLLNITSSAAIGTSPLAFNGNGTLQMGANNINLGTRAISIANGANATFDTNGNNMTASGLISGAGGLVKVGGGTLTLGGNANTYTGGTAIDGGVLSCGSLSQNTYPLGTASSLGTGMNLTFNGGTLLYTGANTGGSDAVGAAGVFAFDYGNDYNITVLSGGGTLECPNGAITFAGGLAGSGNLTISNPTLSNPSLATMLGHSVFFAGTFRNAGEAFTGNIIIDNNGSLELRDGAANLLSNASLIQIGPNGLFASDTDAAISASEYGTAPRQTFNPMLLDGGTLGVNSRNMSYYGPITVQAGTTNYVGAILNGIGATWLAGNLQGSGTLITTGTGNIAATTNAITLSGSNGGFSGYYESTTAQTIFASPIAGSPNATWVANGQGFIAGMNSTTFPSGGVISLGALTGSTGTLNNATASTTATFSVGALNANTTFGGVIQNGAGTTALTVVGGNLNLTGANTFTGGVTVTGGTLTEAAGALDGASTPFVNVNSALLNVLGGTVSAGTLQVGAVPASNGTLNVSGGVVTVGNSMILGSGASNGTLNLGGGTPLAGTLVTPGISQGSGTGTVNFNGGLLQASGNNASFLTGLTSANVLAGGVYINDAGFSIAIGQSLQTGTSPAPDGGLTKSGAGAVTLTGSNAYTGTTTVNAGNLVLNFAAATAPPSNIVNFASNSSSLTFGGGGSLVVQGAAGANNSQQFNGLTVNSGSGVAAIAVNSGASGAASLSLGAIGYTSGFTVFSLPANGSITTTNANGPLGAWATVSGTGFAQVSGGSIAALPASAYATQVPVLGGTIPTGSSDVAIVDGGSGPLTLAAPTTVVDTILQSASLNAANISMQGGTLQANGIMVPNGAQALTIGLSPGDGVLSATTPGGAVALYSGASGITVNSVIADNTTPSGLYTFGPGAAVLASANTYTGPTTITGGSLAVSGTGSLGNGTYAAAIVNNGSLVFNTSTAQTLSGAITGNGSLVASGPGNLTLSNNNSTFNGGVTINGGNLSVSSISTGGTSAAALGEGPANGSGQSITLNGGMLTYTGAATVGTASPSNNAQGWNSTITLLGGGGTLNDAGGGIAFTGGLAGSGNLTIYDSTGTNQVFINTATPNASSGFTGTITIGPGGRVQQRTSAANPLGGAADTITIDAGGFLQADTGTTAPSTLVNNLVMDGGTVQLQNPGLMTYSGSVDINSGTSTFNTSGSTSQINLAGNLYGSASANSTGTPTIFLNGNNSAFAGTWTVASAAGGITFKNSNAGSPGAVWATNNGTYIANIASGGTVSMGALTGTSGTVENSLAATTSTFSVGALGTNTTFGGLIANGAATAITALNKVGAGSLALTGAYNYTGLTTVSGGTLQLGNPATAPNAASVTSNSILNNSTLVFANAGTQTLASQISGGGTVVFNGPGNVLLAASQAYTGPTVVQGGTLSVVAVAPAAMQLGFYGPTAGFSSGTAADFSGNNNNAITLSGTTPISATPLYAAGVLPTAQSISFGGASGTANSQYAVIKSSPSLSLSGAYTVSLWEKGALTGSSTTASAGGTALFSTRNGGDHDFDLQINNGGLHADIGNGTAFLPAANTTVSLSSGWNMITMAVSTTGYAIYVNGSLAPSGSGTYALYNPVLLTSSAASASVGAQEGGGTSYGTASMFNGTVSQVDVFSGALSAAQIASLYNNPVLSPNSALPSASAVSVAAGATLNLGITEAIGSLAGAGTVTNSVVTAPTLTVGGDNSSQTFAGLLQNGAGTLTVVKMGTGMWTLAGNNTYSGATTVNGGGTLQLGNGGTTGSLGTGGLTMGNAWLSFNRSDVGSPGFVFSLPITSGTVSQDGPGTTTLTASNTYAGGTFINNGTLQVGNSGSAGSLGSGPVTINMNGSLSLMRSDAIFTLANTLIGSGNIFQNGSGTASLSGPATGFTGSISVNNGALFINSANNTSGITVGPNGMLGGSSTATQATASVLTGGTVAAGNAGGVGHLTLGGLSLAAGTEINITSIGNFSATSSLAPLTIGNGGLTATGNSASVTFSLFGQFPNATTTQTAHLIQYTGTITGNGLYAPPGSGINTQGLIGFGARSSANLVYTDPGYIDLQYSNDYPIWTGLGTSIWDTQPAPPPTPPTDHNWKLASTGAPNFFLYGDDALFDDTAGTAQGKPAGSSINVFLNAVAGTNNSFDPNLDPTAVTFNNNAYNYVLSGTNSIEGTVAVTFNGSGSVTISNANTYGGVNTINAGRVVIDNVNALGQAANGATLTINGGTLDNDSPITTDNYPITWNGQFTFAGRNFLDLGAGAVTLATSTAAVNVSGSTLQIDGAIGDGGAGYGFTQTGAGVLLLTASNTYGGPTVVNGGTLQVGNGGSGASIGSTSNVLLAANTLLLFDHNDSQTFTASIGGSGSMTQSGAGLLNLTNSNTYTGSTTVNSGSLELSFGGPAGTLAPGATVTVNTGATLLLNASNALGTSGSFTNLAVNSGGFVFANAGFRVPLYSVTMTGGTLASDSGNGDGNGNYSLGGTLNATSDASGNPALIAATQVSLVASSTLNVTHSAFASPADLVISSSISSFPNGNGLTIQGNGFTQFTGANTYNGGTTVLGGTLQLASALATVGSNTGGLTISSGALLDISGDSVSVGGLNGGGTIDNVAGTFGATPTLTIGNGNGSGTFSGTIQNTSGATNVVKVGTGKEVLSGTNSYTGGTTLTAGVLDFVPSALPFTTSPPNITFNGGTLQWAVGNTEDVSGGIVPMASGKSASLDTNGNNVTFNSSLSGAGGLTKLGGGTLTLAVADTYAGTTTITAGTLNLADPLAVQNSTVSIGASGALSFATGITSPTLGGLSGAGSLALATVASEAVTLNVGNNYLNTTYTGALSGAGSLTKIGSGSLTLAGAVGSSYSGATLITGGSLQALSHNNIMSPNSAVAISNGSTFNMTNTTQSIPSLSSTDGLGSMIVLGSGLLTVGNAGSSTFDGAISGIGGRVALPGAGSMLYTGSNTYTGATTVSGGGTLQLGDGAVNNGNLVGNTALANNSALIFANPLAQTYAGVISGSGSVTKNGPGTVQFQGNHTYSGPTVINAGTVQLAQLSLANGFGANTGSGTANGVQTPGAATSQQVVHPNNGTWTLTTNGGYGNGNATYTPVTGGVLDLTDGTATNSTQTYGYKGSRSAFYNTPLPVYASFNMTFTYTASSSPANAGFYNYDNGFAFVIQNDSRGASAIGGPGRGWGVGTNPEGGNALTAPIGNSAEINYDLFSYSGEFNGVPIQVQGPATGYNTNGGTATTYPTAGLPVFGGASSTYTNLTSDPINMTVSYNAATQTLTWSGTDVSFAPPSPATFSYSQTGVNLQTITGGSAAYFGFTGADGQFGSTQLISNFNISQAGVSNVLPSTTPLFIASGGTLDLNGVNQAVGDLSGAGVVTNTSAIAKLSVGTDGSAQTFSGTLQDGGGTLALAVVGGSLTLSGTNTYSGGTTVDGGTLIATNSEAIEDGTNLNVGDSVGSFFSPTVPGGGSAAPVSNSQAAAAVPEAGTLSLMMAALSAVAVYRRLRRSRRAGTVAKRI